VFLLQLKTTHPVFGGLNLLEYGCELWDDCCIRDTQILECLQLEAARIVTGLPIYSSAESLYFETHHLQLLERQTLK
jgi:hypothetical protein